MRIPDSQVGHLGEVAHRLPVAGDRSGDDLPAVLAGEPVAAGRDLHAGGQPLDVPLPRAGRRLIEVVDVEDQLPLRGAEDAEVRQVRIPARLHRQPRHRSTGKVAGHRQRRAAVEGERGDHHPAPPDRHQLRHPRLGLLLQQADRVGRPAPGRTPHGSPAAPQPAPPYPAPRAPPESAAPAPTPAGSGVPPGTQPQSPAHSSSAPLSALRATPARCGASFSDAMPRPAGLFVSPRRVLCLDGGGELIGRAFLQCCSSRPRPSRGCPRTRTRCPAPCRPPSPLPGQELLLPESGAASSAPCRHPAGREARVQWASP